MLTGNVATASAETVSISDDGSKCEQVFFGAASSSSQQEDLPWWPASPPGQLSWGPQPVHEFLCWQKEPQQQSAHDTACAEVNDKASTTSRKGAVFIDP